MQMNYKSINKAIMFTIILIVFLGSIFNVSYGESDDIYVYIDSERVSFDINPILKDGRVLVPMRKIFEKLEAEVTWDEETRSVYAERDNVEIRLTIDNKLIDINGEEIIMDTAPVLYKGTTLVPLRIISEAYGLQVKWNGDNRKVSITSNPIYVKNKDIKLDMGMSVGDLRSIMGDPSRIDPGEFDVEWYTYNNSPINYRDYILIRVDDDRVTGFQTNSENWILSDMIKVNDNFHETQLKKDFKDKHPASAYGLNIYPYKVDNIINSFSIIQVVPANLWDGEYSIERLKGIEKQIFDMTNVYRINKDLQPLVWNNMISKFAKNHSQDMMENDYFSHDSLTQSYQERIQPLLINGDWNLGGENLGFGDLDSIIVMNGWYNSEGHRDNLLYKGWKYHGVGVVNTKTNKIYATQNFTE